MFALRDEGATLFFHLLSSPGVKDIVDLDSYIAV